MRYLLPSILGLAALATTLPSMPVSPIPPCQESFYTAPADIESATPGTILRLRTAPGNLTTTTFTNASTAYNILYRTTNAHYEPSWAVTTLFVPKETNNTALLSYQIPYNSADVDASPSYSLYAPGEALGLIGTDIQAALSRGWYVNVPDHEGPLASFACGVAEGHAVLDSVRAVSGGRFGLEEGAKAAMRGYSGGSIASEWAAELQVQCAPGLEFAGTAIGGVVSNGSEIFPAISGSIWAGLGPSVLLGLTTQYPDARSYLLSHLKIEGPYNKTGFFRAENLSITEAFAVYANQTLYDYFTNGEAFFEAPVIADMIIEQLQMGYHGVPQMPLYVYKAVADEITSIQSTDMLVETYCGVGADILYERNTVGGHLAEETNGDQSALEWLAGVLEGSYRREGYTVRDVAIGIDDSPL